MIFVACVHVVFGFYLELGLLHESLMCDLRKNTLFNNYFGFERLGSCISGRGAIISQTWLWHHRLTRAIFLYSQL